MKITIDLDETRYPAEWNGDPDTEPRFVGTIQEAIVSHAAYQVRRDLFTERDKEATNREITLARQEAINVQIAPIVAEAIAQPLRKTNSYGEATGPEVTLRQLIIDEVTAFLNEPVGDSYSRNRSSRAATLIREEVANVVAQDLKSAIAEAKVAAVKAVTDAAAEVVAEKMRAQLGLR